MSVGDALPLPDQRAVTRAPQLLVASDFDGTLAPFHDDPMAVVPDAASLAALRRLAGLPGTHVALVSGRDLQTLQQLSGLGPADGVSLLGSHGTQRWYAGQGEPEGLDEDEAAQREVLVTGGRRIVDDHPGATLEVKAAGVVVHTRRATAEVATSARAAVRRLGRRCGIEVMVGKDVLELGVRPGTKGQALRELVQHLDRETRDRYERRSRRESCPGHVLWFAGDDVTDETVFRAFAGDAGSLMVKVGEGRTAATSRVAGIPEVAQLLTELADARAQHLAGRGGEATDRA